MRSLLKILLIAVLLLIALNAVLYGSYFLADPKAGLGEFGYDTSGTIDDAAKILVGLAGIGFIGFAAFSILAAWMVIKGDRAGLSVTIVLGGTYLLIGTYAMFNQLRVDAYIYGGFGITITLLAGTLWKFMAPASIRRQPIDRLQNQFDRLQNQ